VPLWHLVTAAVHHEGLRRGALLEADRPPLLRGKQEAGPATGRLCLMALCGTTPNPPLVNRKEQAGKMHASIT